MSTKSDGKSEACDSDAVARFKAISAYKPRILKWRNKAVTPAPGEVIEMDQFKL